MYGTKTQDEFAAALQSFVAGCQKIYDDYMAKNFPTNGRRQLEIELLQKRARIKNGDGVYCFVDFATGDVLKSASYATPAKGARGNIYDEKNGLATMGPYGAAYKR